MPFSGRKYASLGDFWFAQGHAVFEEVEKVPGDVLGKEEVLNNKSLAFLRHGSVPYAGPGSKGQRTFRYQIY